MRQVLQGVRDMTLAGTGPLPSSLFVPGADASEYVAHVLDIGRPFNYFSNLHSEPHDYHPDIRRAALSL